MSEQWGFCDRCNRWFYTQRSEAAEGRVRCPVCDASPSRVREGEPETISPA